MTNGSYPLSFGQQSILLDAIQSGENIEDWSVRGLIRLPFAITQIQIEEALCEAERTFDSLHTRIADIADADPEQLTQTLLQPRSKISIRELALEEGKWWSFDEVPVFHLSAGYCWSAEKLTDPDTGNSALRIWVNHIFADVEAIKILINYLKAKLFSQMSIPVVPTVSSYVNWEREKWATGRLAKRIKEHWAESAEVTSHMAIATSKEQKVSSIVIPCAQSYVQKVSQMGTSLLKEILWGLIHTQEYSEQPSPIRIETANRRFSSNKNLVISAVQFGLTPVLDPETSREGLNNPILSTIQNGWFAPRDVEPFLPKINLVEGLGFPWIVNIAMLNRKFPDDDLTKLAKVQFTTDSYTTKLCSKVANYIAVNAWSDALEVRWVCAKPINAFGDIDNFTTDLQGLVKSIS